MNKIQELNKDGSVKKGLKGIKFAVIGVIAIVLAASSFTIVPAGNSGVILTLGKVSETSIQKAFT